VAHLVGDVEGRHCLLVDDMISTGGTLRKSVAALREAGATGFTVSATHGLLVDDALARLVDAGIGRVFVTDTVQVPGDGDAALRVVSVAPLLAGALRHLAGADDEASGDGPRT
jgi:ribose-phosphate pyrophosphokinase